MRKAGCGSALYMQFLCPFSVESGHITFSALMCDIIHNIVNQRSSPVPQCSEFLLGLHYIGMVGWLIAHILISASVWSKVPTLKHMVFLAWPKNIGYGWAHPNSPCPKQRCSLSGMPWLLLRSWGQMLDYSLGMTKFFITQSLRKEQMLACSWRNMACILS